MATNGPHQLTGFLGEHREIVGTLSTAAAGIAGWSLSFKVYNAVTGAVVVTKTTGAGDVEVTNAGAKEITATLDADDLTTAGRYTWDVFRTDAGFESCLFFGGLHLKARGALN